MFGKGKRKFISNKMAFTLLELQIAMVVILITVGGFGVALMSYLKQLEWSENKRALYSVVSDDYKVAIFTEISSPITGSKVKNDVEIQRIWESGGNVLANTKLK